MTSLGGKVAYHIRQALTDAGVRFREFQHEPAFTSDTIIMSAADWETVARPKRFDFVKAG